MYDIRNDSWSACPKRKQKGGNHNSFCMNGKLYIVFGDTGGIRGRPVEHKTIERLDVKAHIEG